MSPEESALKRAYSEIKRRIFEGSLAARTRIDVEALARALGVSSTPVRQALVMLIGEGLVKPGRQSGYEVSLWSEQQLADLYGWRGALLNSALSTNTAGDELKRAAALSGYTVAVAQVMRLIDASANPELRRAAINADDRLHAARVVEAEVLGDVQAEFAMLAQAIADRSKRAKSMVRAYHQRRIQSVTRLRERAVLRSIGANGGG